jgi:phage gp29-like protein
MAKNNKIHNPRNKVENKAISTALYKNGRATTSESVITRIIEQSNYRIRKDVSDWRKAINFAESKEHPRRWLLLNLYDDLVLDNHLYAQIQIRMLKVLGLDFKIVDSKTKKQDDDKTMLLKKQWFYKFIRFSLEAIFNGHSLVQISDIKDGEVAQIDLVPRRHVRPEYGDYIVHQIDNNGTLYRGTPLMDWLVEIGEPNDLGLLMKAAPNVLWKKNAQMCWSEYCEIFGMPLRVGKTNTRSLEDLDRVESQLQRMGSASYAVLQTGESVEFIESTKGDAFNVYDKLIERCNSEMSKLILGQTLTSDVGKSGTRSQGEVHERVAEVITKADILFVEHIVNDKLIPVLIKHGYNLNGFNFEFVIKQELTALDWTIDSGLSDRFEIDPQYFIEKYSVPIISVKETKQDKKVSKDKMKLEAKSDFHKIVTLHASLDKLYNKTDCCEHD